jgi:ATP-dependent DNA helicase RecG
MFQDITLTIEDERLVISNPGGLYGLSVKELGRTGSKTRNARLSEICQYVVGEDGQNVIEKLGSGIPKIMEELSAANMPPPTFIDGGIYFTAILKSGEYSAADTSKAVRSSSGKENKILKTLENGAFSKQELMKKTLLTSSQLRYALEKLIRADRVCKTGQGSSPHTKYSLKNL